MRYTHPKIITLDMAQEVVDALKGAGLNVTQGTFGVPRSTKPSDKYEDVSLESVSLPGLDEQEIVICNTCSLGAVSTRDGARPGDGVVAWWQRCDDGDIDPRPLAMAMHSKSVSRTLGHLGALILVASTRYAVSYRQGVRHNDYRIDGDELIATNWSLFPPEADFSFQRISGSEVTLTASASELPASVAVRLKEATYSCALNHDYHTGDWVPLAVNKFQSPVAGIWRCKNRRSLVLVIPEIPRLHECIQSLIEGFVAEACPTLFPEHEGAKWLHFPQYEVPRIVSLASEADEVRKTMNQRLSDIDAEIEAAKKEHVHWYELLKGTGKPLVDAVIDALRRIGFSDVTDVDAATKGGSLREDVLVLDRSEPLVIDVKGVAGHPEDAESTQAEKHALIRSREMQKLARPLTIINHQRFLPPHSRASEPYRREIVDNAVSTGLGLMTTWDLWKVLRNMERCTWPSEQVKDIFYRSGRIRPVPSHYHSAGTILHVWKDKNAFGFVPTRQIGKGDILAIEVDDLFVELAADSIHVDDVAVNVAEADSKCGVVCSDVAKRFRPGLLVFQVVAP